MQAVGMVKPLCWHEQLLRGSFEHEMHEMHEMQKQTLLLVLADRDHLLDSGQEGHRGRLVDRLLGLHSGHQNGMVCGKILEIGLIGGSVALGWNALELLSHEVLRHRGDNLARVLFLRSQLTVRERVSVGNENCPRQNSPW